MPAIHEPPHAFIDQSRGVGGMKPVGFRAYSGRVVGFKPAVPARIEKIGGRYEIVRMSGGSDPRKE